jgi:ElaB/YqjD/DUF883 family membrane-anchored ribosome-binding protein
MSSTSTAFHDPVAGKPGIAEKVSEVASQVSDKVSELGRVAADKIDARRESAAMGLTNAAQALHENAHALPGGEKVSTFAHDTADKLTSTAEYVREHNVKKMMCDVGQAVRNNPGPALLTAGVIGFLVGRAFTGNRY